MRVDYEHVFQYRYDTSGNRFPIFTFDLVNPTDPALRISVDGYLDTGCSRSLLDARLALSIGLDPLRGRRVPFMSAAGMILTGVLCPSRLEHPELGSFELEIGFAQIHLSRNLLGRDFLSQLQFGLRERNQEFYLSRDS